MATDNNTRPTTVDAFLLSLPVKISYDNHPGDVRASAKDLLSGLMLLFDLETEMSEHVQREMPGPVFTLLQSVMELLNAADALDTDAMDALRRADAERRDAESLDEEVSHYLACLRADHGLSDEELAQREQLLRNAIQARRRRMVDMIARSRTAQEAE